MSNIIALHGDFLPISMPICSSMQKQIHPWQTIKESSESELSSRRSEVFEMEQIGRGNKSCWD